MSAQNVIDLHDPDSHDALLTVGIQLTRSTAQFYSRLAAQYRVDTAYPWTPEQCVKKVLEDFANAYQLMAGEQHVARLPGLPAKGPAREVVEFLSGKRPLKPAGR
jgi:hypothetical protein